MRRTLAVFIGATVTAAAAAGGLHLTAAADNGHSEFTVVSHDSQGTMTPGNFGVVPFVQNQQASEDAPVYRGAKQVGDAQTVFTVTRDTSTDVVLMVECGVELADGKLFFNGPLHLNDLAKGGSVPVEGGTGRYTGAHGIVVLTSVDNGSSTSLRFDISMSGE